MFQLIYASAATRPFTPDELATLLSRARARNGLYNVTGMLLYHSGSFLQVLEGGEKDVNLVFSSIQRDPRHTNTRLLFSQNVAKREFEQWSMGFVDTSTLGAVPGLVDYHRALPALTLGSGEARRYLRFFREGLCRQR